MPESLQLIIKPPFRDIKGRFVKASQGLLEGRRQMLRTLGQKFIALERMEAPEGKTGRFRGSLSFKTFDSGNSLTLKAYMAQPLGSWITGGTSPHTIAARNAGALYFFWPRVGMFTIVPKSDGFRTHAAGGQLWIGKGFVNHPGTKPNPFVQRAYSAWMPEAQVELRRISRDYVAVLKGMG